MLAKGMVHKKKKTQGAEESGENYNGSLDIWVWWEGGGVLPGIIRRLGRHEKGILTKRGGRYGGRKDLK